MRILASNIIDLTHELDEGIPTWELDCGFKHKLHADYDMRQEETKFRVQKITMHAGAGTHMDAPAHCISGGKCVSDIPLRDLLKPCVVIDVSERTNAGFQMTKEDVLMFEAQYGKIPSGAFIIVYTGWDKFWRQREQYHNNYRFPSVRQDAAEILLNRNVAGLGIDTLSPDRPDSGFIVHQLLLESDKIIVENIANAKLMPAIGADIWIVPLKIKGATESPIRLIGIKN